MSIEFLSESKVSIVDSMASDDNVAMSAWVSFGNDHRERLEDRKRVQGLINFLYREQHHTPFESSVFTFRIETPIFVARELFRHRSASYNEWSGRYSEMLPKFYMPSQRRPLLQKGKPGDYHFVPGDAVQYGIVVDEYTKSCNFAWESYQRMLEAGIAKEVSRNVLPLTTYTQFYVTMNARNLMHFLTLRNDSHALFEIRHVAIDMEGHLVSEMPFTYEAYKSYDWRDERSELEFLRRRVAQFEAEETYR